MNSSSDNKPQRVVYSGTYNMPLLLEELYEVFPNWVVNQRGLGKVQATSDGVRIIFPKSTPTASVDTIVAAHDHIKPSKNERDKKDKKKLRKDGKKKLKDLGLTQAEVNAIIGAD